MDITDYLSNCVKLDIPVSFSKYGDGEYLCATGNDGHNCDNDNYTDKKSSALIQSIKYMVDNTTNAYIARWHHQYVADYWQSLTTKPIRWALYHTIIFDGNNDDAKVRLYKSIRNNKSMVKIIICNEKVAKAKKLLDLHYVIIVPCNNWFDIDFDKHLDQVKNIINKDGRNPLIITSCGMSAKVMIYELSKLYPHGIYLDFGSGLDTICTQERTRLGQQSYEYLVLKLKDILPYDWNKKQEPINIRQLTSRKPQVPPKKMPIRLQRYLQKKNDIHKVHN